MNDTRELSSPPADDALTERHLAELVDRFYERVRADPELGPVFNAAIDDWPEHKRMLTQFWSSVALGTRSYRGNPMAAHRPHPIRAEHFDRWLSLWRETARDVLPPDQVERVYAYAEKIGYSLRYGLGLMERKGALPLGLPTV
ncbi:group III truncated hemoglobin [Lysobacter auxotrophicus]|uniref:Group III truncated hemoglobin n=1 Tax=Lysobacter auxotrophicus TaxID=2992573 RepID=A0ABN6UNH8_9GAMM|nr:group III truncated hemoglobin [Lysobacter auxotrophicus]BDU17916.1 group III truncated hemoglobin [Lysobacter auxotrophicus]